MSMYAAFLKEYYGDEMIETDEGWVQFRYLNDKQCYIVNIYIASDYRKSGTGSALADKVVEQAKLKGCTELLGTVVPSAHNSTDSLRVMLGYKMKLKSSSNDLIVFGKDI